MASDITLASALHANRALVGLGKLLIRCVSKRFHCLKIDAKQIRFELKPRMIWQHHCAVRAVLSEHYHYYQQAAAVELALLPTIIADTKVERIVLQRIGQDKFRDAMLDY